MNALSAFQAFASLATYWVLPPWRRSFSTVVVDHMGRPDVGQPLDGPQFGLFQRLMREHGNVWSKVSCPERLTHSGPPALHGE